MKVHRNSPCPCGSGLKYKKCCTTKRDGISTSYDLKKKKTKRHSATAIVSIDILKEYFSG